MSFQTGAEDYFRNANDNVLVVLQIEHITGVENADAILSVPGVDACFIGPNDLAASMGLGLGVPLESDQPALVEAIAEIRNACVRNGVAPGIHCSGAAGINQTHRRGFPVLRHGHRELHRRGDASVARRPLTHRPATRNL